MRVEELFQQLSYGELSNLALAVDGTGTIKASHHPRIVLHANEALTRLYSRFLLKEKDESVTVLPATQIYALAATDVVRVLAVYSAFGESLPLNDTRAPSAIGVREKTLILPHLEGNFAPGKVLDVVYQARHPLLTGDLAQEIELPDCLTEALLAYITSRVYAGVNSVEAQAASAQHGARFQNVCDDALRYGLVSSGAHTDTNKFTNRGWI